MFGTIYLRNLLQCIASLIAPLKYVVCITNQTDTSNLPLPIPYTKARIPLYGCVMRVRHAVCGKKWLQWEGVGMIPYVRMWTMRKRMRQTESGCVEIHTASAPESIGKTLE